MHHRGYAQLSTDDTDTHREDAVTIGLPPAWVDISEEIATNMQRARSKISTLVKTYAKALMPTFGDTISDQHAIEELTQEITHLLKRSEQMLQKLSGHGLSEDASVQKNVQRSLATDLQSLSMEFRKQQKAYLQRLQQLQDGPDGVDIGIDLNGQKSRHDEDDFFDLGFNEQQLARMKKSEALTAEREREILQIVESVNELQQIMKDLSSLVIDQGTIVDRIDYNVQNVAASVDEGVKQLQKAERTQREGGMVMCATVLIFMCLFMIFVLIIKEIFV
jgi:syntaxin 16